MRTLAHHLPYQQRRVPPLLEGPTIEQAGDRFESDHTGQDAAAWPGLPASPIEQAHAAVAQPRALDRTAHLSFDDTSGQEYVIQPTADPASHAWDLARATGQHDTLDPGAVTLLLPRTQANAALPTASGMFGSPIDTGPAAPDDARLPGPARPQDLNARPVTVLAANPPPSPPQQALPGPAARTDHPARHGARQRRAATP